MLCPVETICREIAQEATFERPEIRSATVYNSQDRDHDLQLQAVSLCASLDRRRRVVATINKVQKVFAQHPLRLRGLRVYTHVYVTLQLSSCRAYKLGKRRWSYNQCELTLHRACSEDGAAHRLTALEAVYHKDSSAEEDSTVGQVQVTSPHFHHVANSCISGDDNLINLCCVIHLQSSFKICGTSSKFKHLDMAMIFLFWVVSSARAGIQATYQVRLENGLLVKAVLYLVYAEPAKTSWETDLPHEADACEVFQWWLVTRSE